MSIRPVPQGDDAKPVRVAVVGLGWAARSIWLPRLAAHPAFDVVAAVDPRPEARAAVARGGAGAGAEAGAVAGARAVAGADMVVLSEVDELAADMVDIAVVAVPNHLHCAVASRLLANGISVFLEKPVCLTSGEADRLAAAERAGGAVLLAGSAARYRSDVRSMIEFVAEHVGRIRHVELAWIRAQGVPDAGGWFTRRRLAGGGALVDLGWHLLDTVTPLLGPVGYDQVAGTTSDDFVNSRSRQAAWRGPEPVGADLGEESGERFGERSDDNGDVEDTARAFLVTEGGVSVSLRASWASHEARDLTLIKVEGSAGTATLRCTFGFSPNRQDRSTLTCTRDGETFAIPVPAEPIGSEYDRQVDELPRLLADPDSRGRAIAETRRTIRVIERVYESARLARAGGCPAPAVLADL